MIENACFFRFAAEVSLPRLGSAKVNYDFEVSFNLADVVQEIFAHVFPKLLAFAQNGGIPVSTTQVEWLCATVKEAAEAELNKALKLVGDITDEFEGVIDDIKRIANGFGSIMGDSIDVAVDVPLR